LVVGNERGRQRRTPLGTGCAARSSIAARELMTWASGHDDEVTVIYGTGTTWGSALVMLQRAKVRSVLATAAGGAIALWQPKEHHR
jgi:hypothetical protein